MTAYRVISPLVQILDAPSGSSEPTEKHFYQGAILPGWVSQEALQHLVNVGAVEPIEPIEAGR